MPIPSASMGAVVLAAASCIATGLHGQPPRAACRREGGQFLRQESRFR